MTVGNHSVCKGFKRVVCGEYVIQNTLQNFKNQGKTMIVIAHRLSTIINSDEILVMKDGKIIEQGNHNKLISQNSIYKTMWEKQTIVFN